MIWELFFLRLLSQFELVLQQCSIFSQIQSIDLKLEENYIPVFYILFLKESE